ncbi:uncharacterized protein [Haliotis cracherodii]|uniref:uncharacterized protein n=1 Tax=Haliotis cracherodii TaxID=6455 RepID=UPI0039E7DA68
MALISSLQSVSPLITVQLQDEGVVCSSIDSVHSACGFVKINLDRQQQQCAQFNISHNHLKRRPDVEYQDNQRRHDEYQDKHRRHGEYQDKHRRHGEYQDKHRRHEEYQDKHRRHDDYKFNHS